jgi:aspartate/methionine/tyrosine aminotransferase
MRACCAATFPVAAPAERAPFARPISSSALTGGSPDLLDVTHFDTIRFPAPEWTADYLAAAERDGSLAYTPYRGHAAVLDALSESVSKLIGVPVDRPNLLPRARKPRCSARCRP